MKTYKLTVFIEVNENNLHIPTLKEFIDSLDDEMNTPDNDHFGIIKVEVSGEEVENH